VRLSYSVMPTALTAPLRDGRVRPDGLELDVSTPKSTDANSRAMLKCEFDVAEMSIAAFAKAVENGLPLVALPVFTSGRRFVQSGFLFSAGSQVRTLEGLRGGTVGVPQYWLSSCFWQRMALRELYGIAPVDVRWVSAQPERFDDVPPPPGVDLRLADGPDLAELAAQVDALLMPVGDVPPPVAAATVPAYGDCAAAERDFYWAAGVFPLMHVTVLRAELAERDGVVPALLEAYARAKAVAAADPGTKWPLPPFGHDVTALRELLGGDPWPYGLARNRAAIDAFLDAAAAQGLLRRRVAIDEMFVRD
jgi:4,5-dihydroxyphthalate decarboxylase